ncbi:hypothetical protein NC651_008093 [Populus alba x Populus x berolinensis]|nr:hypothetical protein NC651_008093 [Populus alba x Populus x berolinensis]
MSTIIIVVSGCPVTLSGSNKWYAAHMISTSLTTIFQASVYRIPLFRSRSSSYRCE